MSDPSETGGRPLASNIQQPEGSTRTSSLRRHARSNSQSSDERIGGTTSSSPRRRLGSKKEAMLSPHIGSSRGDSSTMQRSLSPTQMSPESASVHYTRTGRISKAKKGLKVHNCECGRSYTRAEHLRRHQKNHAQDALVCEFPECGKTFYRVDLLQRHQERHNEIGPDSRQPSLYERDTAEPEPRDAVPVSLATPIGTTISHTAPYYPQTLSPLPEATQDPRYTSDQFRTPQIPSSNFGHILRSSPHSKSGSNQKQAPYTHRQSRAAIGVQVGDLQPSIAWNDPFTHSPEYSSSDGYASPIPIAGDHANLFANFPYGPGPNRTRTPSNASFIEPPWGYPSRSPTSATSTMAYTWTSNEKSPAPSSLAYMASSYSMTSAPMAAGVDPMTAYGHFGPKTMAQRDEEEQAFLFPEQSYGMGQLANHYPFEQYLDNYWRHFHPSFPVVHRSTIGGISPSPMLHAAMTAVGGQYSNDASVKRKSRILHDRCLKLLEKRELDLMTEEERLCDYQALFLVEVLSQYRARRAAKTLSPRFENVYHKFCDNYRGVTSDIIDHINALGQPENATYDRWSQWVELNSRQRLLLCCYILEYQQSVFLSREPRHSLIQPSGFDLPFPAHSALWDAQDSSEWALTAQQYLHMPTYVYEVNPDLNMGPFDSFQSALLIAANYHHFGSTLPYPAPQSLPAMDHLLDDSPMTKHQLLTAKLLQYTPIRAMLAVSGESWILSEKVPSPQAFSGHKATLRTWVSGLWAATSDIHGPAVKDALKLAIEILQHAMIIPPHALRLELGADMGLYFAALTIWTVTVAANTRINAPQASAQPQRYQSHSPLPTNRNHNQYPSPSMHLSTSTSPNPTHAAAIGLLPHSHTSVVPAPTSHSMLHTDITMTSIHFLNQAILELDLLGMIPQWPREIAQWQQGCSALMRWVKMRLRNGALEGRDSAVGMGPTSAGTGRGGDGLGELLDGVIGVLEKTMGRGWEGWGV